jgi:C-terminal processing protease CtpA/Prc
LSPSAMKRKTTIVVKLSVVCLAVFGLGYENTLAATSEDPDLKAQQPTLETQAPTEMVAPLQGTVSKTGTGEEQKLEGGVGQQASEDKKWHLKSLAHKHKLTSEDYRNLEFGITGFVSTKLLFSAHPVVTELFPGCPAEQVGIRLGDHIIQANDHAFTWRDMQRQYWRYLDGRAGTIVDLTISRKGQPMTFKLTLMNIEDVPNDKLRRMYERMVRALGAPGQE